MYPLFHQHKHPKSAFTLAEMLITLAVIALIAVLILPKILDSGSGKVTQATVKDIYTNVGEVFMKYQQTKDTMDWGNEAAPFQAYMLDHLNGQPCAAGCLMEFPTGAKVISVTNEPAVNGVSITVSAPKISSNFEVLIAPPAADPTGKAVRYSTRFGVTGSGAIADVEEILNTQ